MNPAFEKDRIEPPDLTIAIGGLTLKNPVMTASGTFGYGEEYAPFVDLNRLGAVVVKGLSLEPRSGNPPPRIMETPSGMLNAVGGAVFFGVDRKGSIQGQQISEQTLHEVTSAFQRFEPSAQITIERVKVDRDMEVLALCVEPNTESVPFTFAGVPYERVGNTTRRMAQAKYEKLLLDRAHSVRRWENEPAYGVTISVAEPRPNIPYSPRSTVSGRIW